MSVDGLPVGSPAFPTDQERADRVEHVTNELMFGVTGTTPEANVARLAAARGEAIEAAARLEEVRANKATIKAEEPEHWHLYVTDEARPSLHPSAAATQIMSADGDVVRAIDAAFLDSPVEVARARSWVAFQSEPLEPVEDMVREMLLGVPGFTPEANRLRAHKADQELSDMQDEDEQASIARRRFIDTNPTAEERDAYDRSVAPLGQPGEWHRPLAGDGNVLALVADVFAPRAADEVAHLDTARAFLTGLGADPALISEQTRTLTEPHIDQLMLGVSGTTPEANSVRLARAEAGIRNFEMNLRDPQEPWSKDRVPVDSVHYPLRTAGGDVQAAFASTNFDPVAQDMAARVLLEHEARSAQRSTAEQPRQWWQRRPKADVAALDRTTAADRRLQAWAQVEEVAQRPIRDRSKDSPIESATQQRQQ